MECFSYLRNVTDILSDGKTLYERRFGKPCKGPIIPFLVHWLSITLSLRKTSQESINLERKSHLDCSSDTLCTREEFGRVTFWLQTLRSWDGRIRNLLEKTQCKRGDISQRKRKVYFSNRRWTNQNFLEEIRN